MLFREARRSEQVGSPETHQGRTPLGVFRTPVSELNEELGPHAALGQADHGPKQDTDTFRREETNTEESMRQRRPGSGRAGSLCAAFQPFAACCHDLVRFKSAVLTQV